MCDETCSNCRHQLYISENDSELCLKGYDVNDGVCKEYNPVLNERFKEIISTQKIVDMETGKEYNGLIDSELLDLMNELNKGYKYG